MLQVYNISRPIILFLNSLPLTYSTGLFLSFIDVILELRKTKILKFKMSSNKKVSKLLATMIIAHDMYNEAYDHFSVKRLKFFCFLKEYLPQIFNPKSAGGESI